MKIKITLIALLCNMLFVPAFAVEDLRPINSSILKKAQAKAKNNPKTESSRNKSLSRKFSTFKFATIADDFPNNVSQAPLQVLDQNNRILISGNLETGGDFDTFSFTLPQAGFLRVLSIGAVDTFGELYLSNGVNTLLADDDDGEGSSNFLIESLVTAGNHTVSVEGFDNSDTGAYHILVEYFPGATDTQIASDDHPELFNINNDAVIFDFSNAAATTQNSSGILERSFDSDIFIITLDTRSLVTMESTSNSGVLGTLYLDTNFNKFDIREGTFLQSKSFLNNDDDFRIVEILDPGTYYLEARAFFNSDLYQISVNAIPVPNDDFINDFNGPFPQTFDGNTITTGNGQVNYIGDRDVFPITLNSESLVNFSTTSNFSTLTGIFKSDGSAVGVTGVLINNGNSFTLENNNVIEAGNYFAVVEFAEGQTGPYNFSINASAKPGESDGFPDRLDETLTASLNAENNEIVNGNFDFIGDTDILGLNYQNPGFVTIKNTSNRNLHVEIYGMNSSFPLSTSFLEPGDSNLLDSLGIAPGDFKITIQDNEFPKATGSYSLETGFVPLSSATPINLNSATNSDINPTDDFRLFSFDLSENGIIDFDITASPNQDFILYDSNPSLIDNDFSDDTLLNPILTTDDVDAGTYYLLALGSNGNFTITNTASTFGLNNKRPFFLDDILSRAINPGDNLDLSLTASDSDFNDTLTFTARLSNGDPLPSGIVLTDNGFGIANFNWTPAANDLGTYEIELTVSDGQVTNTTKFTVTVVSDNPLNTAPNISSIGNQSIDAGNTLNLSLSATDGESDPLSYSATLVNGDPLLSGMVITDNGNGTANFSWTPTNSDVGIVQVKFNVNDGVNTSSETISITVNAVNNNAPVLNAIGNKTVTEAQNLSFTVTATDADASDSLTFTATLANGNPLPAGINFTDNGNKTASFSWTPGNSDLGAIQVKFKVSDSKASVEETISITVNPIPNSAPSISTIGNKVVTEGQNLSFGITATDSNTGDTLSFTATLANDDPLPSGITFTDNTDGTADFSWTPGASDLGTIQVKVAVSDGQVSTEETFSISVNPIGNSAPSLNAIGSKTVTEAQNLSFTVTATDADSGDSLAITATLANGNALPTGIIFTDNADGTASFSWTPGSSDLGIIQVKFTVSDTKVSVEETISITVNAASTGGGNPNPTPNPSPSPSPSPTPTPEPEPEPTPEPTPEPEPTPTPTPSPTPSTFNVPGIIPNGASVNPNDAKKLRRKGKTKIKLSLLASDNSTAARLFSEIGNSENKVLEFKVKLSEEFEDLVKLVIPKSARKAGIIKVNPNANKAKKRIGRANLVIKNKKFKKAFPEQEIVQIPITIEEISTGETLEGVIPVAL